MMKKMVFVVIALVFVLSACSTPAPVATATAVPTVEPTVVPIMEPTVQPVEGISLSQLYTKYYVEFFYGKPISFEFLEPYVENSGYLKVKVNGVTETLVEDQERGQNSEVYIADNAYNFNGGPGFKHLDLFNIYVGSEENVEREFVAFRNGGTGFRESTDTLVLISTNLYDTSEMVDIAKWNDSKVTLVVWEHPASPLIYENLETGEFGSGEYGSTFLAQDDSHHPLTFFAGTTLWGYFHMEYGVVYMTQSEPDPSVFEKTAEISKKYWPEEAYFGPASTCINIASYYEVMNNELSEKQIEEICGVYFIEFH